MDVKIFNVFHHSLQLPDDLFEPGQSRRTTKVAAGKKRKRPTNENDVTPAEKSEMEPQSVEYK